MSFSTLSFPSTVNATVRRLSLHQACFHDSRWYLHHFLDRNSCSCVQVVFWVLDKCKISVRISTVFSCISSSDGSVNKTILKPRLALAARYVGFSRRKILVAAQLAGSLGKAAKFRSLYDIGESNPVPASGLWSGSFFLSSFLFGVTHAPFACQRWGLPHRLAQCATPGKGLSVVLRDTIGQTWWCV